MMPDILIRGMEMPHNCFLCPLSYMRGERLFCHITTDEVIRAKIAPDCPLHELPEHGNLIERVQALRAINNCNIPDGVSEHDFYEVIASVHEAMETVPVIIPASKEETE